MWQTISIRETCERLKTNSVNGLTKDEAEERMKKYGENKLTEKKKESILVKFLKQFNDFMIRTDTHLSRLVSLFQKTLFFLSQSAEFFYIVAGYFSVKIIGSLPISFLLHFSCLFYHYTQGLRVVSGSRSIQILNGNRRCLHANIYPV